MAEDRLVGRRLGGFEVLDVLGQGGFATVYRARQVRLGRDVALKVLDPLLARNADAARRFDREGWAAAGLDHPGIVPVYEAGEEDGVWFLAMRLVDGHSLAEELPGGTPLPAARTVAVIRAVGDALDHAHGRGVLHRDVKPANILVEGDRFWLSDFGIAATAQQVGLYTAGALGTVAYMAPEQARPGEADYRADLYSLGCVAFECLTGQLPFEGSTLAEILYAHAHEPVPPLDNPALDQFFARALAKEPGSRFQSGAELADALEAVVTGTGDRDTVITGTAEGDTLITTPRPQAPTPPRRRIPKLPVILGAAAVVLAVVIAVVATSNSGNKKATTTSTSAAPTTVATMTKAQAATAYEEAGQPVNTAQFNFAGQMQKWTTATTPQQAQSQAQPLLAAVEAVQARLAEIADQYPPAAADLRADAAAAAQVRATLLTLSHLNADVSVATFRQHYNDAIATLIGASNVVRADLGLPHTTNQ